MSNLSRFLPTVATPLVFLLALVALIPAEHAFAAIPNGGVCKIEVLNGSDWEETSAEEDCDTIEFNNGFCNETTCNVVTKTLTSKCQAATANRDDCKARILANASPAASSPSAPSAAPAGPAGTSSGENASGSGTGIPSGENAGDPPSSGGVGSNPIQIQAQRTGTVFLESPISCGGEPCTIPFLVARLINFILSGIGAVAVLMLVYAGIMYMTSAGNEKRMTNAKQTILYTILGLAVIFLALVIVNLTIRLIGVEI